MRLSSGSELSLVFAAFALLAGLTFVFRRDAPRRTAAEWWLDASGLLTQGLFVPLCQSFFLAAVLPSAWRGSLSISWGAAFFLNFVLVDYLYYWNHRALHTGLLWPAHLAHHGATKLDVFATSRNTVWAPLLIVYLWVNGFFLFVLADPAPFAWSAALTAALDLWRHSGFRAHRAVSRILVTPTEHAWHHSDLADVNFAANLSLWDRLHGTYYSPGREPERLGVPVDSSTLRLLFLGGAA